jgi:mono/diheme cytochrome c family protein
LRPRCRALVAALLILLAPASTAVAQTGPSGAEFRVVCEEPEGSGAAPCRADLATFIGARVFGERCASCHGEYAVGSRFAPDLAQRVARMDRPAFFAAMDHGYTGSPPVMEPWARDPVIARYLGELWAYLAALSRGALPPVPVERLPERFD